MQWLIFFRFWVGLGLGGVPVSFTLYMEFMPTKGRGVWLIWLEAFWTLGSCLEAGLAWLVLDSLGWRWLIGLSSIPLGKHQASASVAIDNPVSGALIPPEELKYMRYFGCVSWLCLRHKCTLWSACQALRGSDASDVASRCQSASAWNVRPHHTIAR